MSEDDENGKNQSSVDKILEKTASEIDNLEKATLDKIKIRKIDKTKKRAVVESVVDERTAFLLNKLLVDGKIEILEGIISAGKEANVYLAYDREGNELAVKIYKIDKNTSRWMKNYIIGDPRFKKIPKNASKIIFLWASKEFKNLKRMDRVGLNVPKPYFCKDNVLIMKYIGFGPIPAPKLKDIKNPKNIDELMNKILDYIRLCYKKAKLVHSDLSEFNILYHNQEPIFIDVSQAVSIDHPKAEKYLVRDIKNIFKFFEKFDLELPDPYEFYYSVIGDN